MFYSCNDKLVITEDVSGLISTGSENSVEFWFLNLSFDTKFFDFQLF